MRSLLIWNAAASILAPPQKEGNAWQAQGNREAGERSGTDAGRPFLLVVMVLAGLIFGWKLLFKKRRKGFGQRMKAQ